MLLLALLSGASSAATLNVPDDHATLADALGAASDGDVIRVSPGAWSGSVVVDALDVTIESVGNKLDTTLEGTSSPAVHVTNGAIVTLAGFTIDANQRLGVLVDGASTLTLADSDCTDGVDTGGFGGCVRSVGGSSLTVRRSHFYDNDGSGNVGGHIGVREGASLVVEDSLFVGGSGTSGGAIYVADTAVVSITGSRFGGGSASFDGGAVHALDCGDVTIASSRFHTNSARYGGAVTIAGATGLVEVTDSVFHANTSSNDAGAVKLYQVSGTGTVDSSVFLDNATTGDGGALKLSGCAACDATDLWLQGNAADSDGGSVVIVSSNAATLRRSVLYDNTSYALGGAVYVNTADVLLAANLMCGNVVPDWDDNGGAVYIRSSGDRVTLSSSIFVDNVAGNHGGAVSGYESDDLTLEHNAFLDNDADDGGHVRVYDADAFLKHNVFAWALGGAGVHEDTDADITSTFNLYYANTGGHRDGVDFSISDIDGTSPEFVAYSRDGDCTNDDLRPVAGGSLVDVGDPTAPADLDGTIPDLGALGGPGAADVRWWNDDDADGFLAAADCHDGDALLNPATTWYEDLDRDGLGDPSASQVGCVPPGVDWVLDGTDCDPADPAAGDPNRAWYPDVDGDGFGDPVGVVNGCYPPPGYVADGTDCDDADARAFPGQVWYDDADADGYGDPDAATSQCLPLAGAVVNDDDCDDGDAAVHPDTTWYGDADGDGVGDTADAVVACDPGAGHVLVADDCDDGDPSVGAPVDRWPDQDGDGFGDASEAPVLACPLPNTVDNALDCDDSDPALNPNTVWYLDTDADGFGDTGSPVVACEAPPLGVRDAGDCDDTDPAVSPSAPEVCNGVDDDCDAAIDDDDPNVDLSGAPTWYDDDDRDGYGDASSSVVACEGPATHVLDATDCDDADPTVHPGAPEQCDDIDHNCNGPVDDGVVDHTWYADPDADGFGHVADGTLVDCAQPDGYALLDGDCDQANPSISPGADEVCNGVDDDCSGVVDDNAIDAPLWYADLDADGFGDPGAALASCDQPLDHVADPSDCDDASADTHLGAPELCDGRDNDCDQLVDDAAIDQTDWYPDSDGDGWGDLAGSPVVGCTPPATYGAPGDCDDTDATVHPEAPEVCDGLDQDCDDQADEDLPVEPWFLDADGDGYGDPAVYVEDCGPAEGYVGDGTDCDDADPDLYPGAPGFDDDCVPVEGGRDLPEELVRGDDASAGCGCDHASGSSGLPWLALLGLTLARRRRGARAAG